MSSSIEKLKEIFRKFPTVGHRTAMRFVYYLAKLPKEDINELVTAILQLQKNVKICQACFNPFEGSELICPICQNPGRNKNILCVVEKEADLQSIESAKKYNGLYFVLGGTLLMMRKEDISKLRIEELKNRISRSNFSEIILALNPTPEGIATSILAERNIKEAGFTGKITHLARGIPTGGELEYIDDETLQSAFDGRK
jgi:recombination protein RecR